MNVLVIDGQGGGLGRQLVAAISAACPEARLTRRGHQQPCDFGHAQGGDGPRRHPARTPWS